MELQIVKHDLATEQHQSFSKSTNNLILLYFHQHNYSNNKKDLAAAAAAAKSLQSCPTLCDPRDGIPIPGILQARTLEWVAISFSNAWKWKVKGKKWNAWKWKVKGKVVSDSSRPHGLQPTRLLRPWDLPGKSTGVGCHCLLLKRSWVNAIKLKVHIFKTFITQVFAMLSTLHLWEF